MVKVSMDGSKYNVVVCEKSGFFLLASASISFLDHKIA